MKTVSLPAKVDVLAPDGSGIRLLLRTAQSSMVHCELPVGAVTQAVAHRTVEELWYCLAGAGELWRCQGDAESVVALGPGVSVDIPTGASFQFRNVGQEPLEIAIVTIPPWPGEDEAMSRQGIWAPNIDNKEE